MMSDIMKCNSCGAINVIKPNKDESLEQYMSQRVCPHCNTKGNWIQQTEDEE